MQAHKGEGLDRSSVLGQQSVLEADAIAMCHVTGGGQGKAAKVPGKAGRIARAPARIGV